MVKRGKRFLFATVSLALFSLFITGCGSKEESASDRAARVSKEDPAMQQARREKKGD